MDGNRTLADLNDHLFAQLERLGDESLAGEELDAEIERARAVGQVAQQVISNASTVLRACEMADLRGESRAIPRMLTGVE